MSTTSLLVEIDRYKAEIKRLQAAADATGEGRYLRALEARKRDYSRCIRTLAEVYIAKPLPQQPVSTLYLAALKPTDAELAWLGGEAPCPHFLGREADLAAIRSEHWPEGA
jgi:hypothetical protein